MIKRILLLLLLSLGGNTLSAQIVYITTEVIPSELIALDLSDNCSSNTIGTISSGGSGLTVLDIAICSDGTAYITDGFNLYSLNLANAQASLIGNMGTGIFPVNALACDPMNMLFGAGFDLYSINAGSGLASNLGNLPFPAGGDLVFYDGMPYWVNINGLFEVNLASPGASTLLMPVSDLAWGLAGYYDSCNQIVSSTPLGDLYLLDPSTQSQTLLCQIPFLASGMASFDDFTLPPECFEYELDLDENNSSGAFPFDFNGATVDCQQNSVPIADSDVLITTGYPPAVMTITLTNGFLDAPLEYLQLNPQPGIIVAGSGTPNLTLTNAGFASIQDFENALQNVEYVNLALPPTSGTRFVEVQYVSTNGPLSNVATAAIPVSASLPMVELGTNQFLCEGESVVLDVGNPGSTYQWSTGSQNASITATTTGLYAVTVTNAAGCPASDQVFLTFFPEAAITLTADQTICDGETATLQITVNGTTTVSGVLVNNVNASETFLTDIGGVTEITVSPSQTTVYELSSVVATGTPPCLSTANLQPVTITVASDVETTIDTTLCSGGRSSSNHTR
ncbi:MAG: hypothetical protein AAFU60_00725 [Bacteroidota bacterium]